VKNNPTWLLVVAGALRAADGRVLMHRRPAGKAHAGLWEFPGGKVEAAETPGFALVRELQEELGIVLDPAGMEPLGFAQQEPGEGERAIVILLYTCRSWAGQPAALEGGEVGWFTLEQAAKLAKPPLDIALLRQLARNAF